MQVVHIHQYAGPQGEQAMNDLQNSRTLRLLAVFSLAACLVAGCSGAPVQTRNPEEAPPKELVMQVRDIAPPAKAPVQRIGAGMQPAGTAETGADKAAMEERGLQVKPADSLARQEGRAALVIGNGRYGAASLKNPGNDAVDMARALEDLGFEVIAKVDAGHEEMGAAIEAFHQNLKTARVGFFYYAGHGMQIDGTNYLLPVDTRIMSSADIRYRAIQLDWILGKMEDSGSKVNIVVLDACRDNPFRGLRGAGSGLAPVQSVRGSFIAYATSPGSVARDGTGRNGIYTTHLLKNIKRPGLTIEEMFREVRKGVAFDTNDDQIPWDSSSLMGVFYMAGTGSVEGDAERRRHEAEQARLDREREELNRLRTDLERRRREASQQEAFPVPKKSFQAPAPYTLHETARDGVFIAYANGIVKDSSTGLEWIAWTGRNMNWNNARSWVQGLDLEGGGWRMPSLNELEGLYREGRGTRNITSLLKIAGWHVWSGETKDQTFAWGFYFRSGDRYSSRRTDNSKGGVLAVRSRGAG